MRWEKASLQEISTRIGDGLHGTPKYDDAGEYYFINGNNLANGRIILKDDTRRISSIEFDKIKKDLNDNTVLVAINGTLGNVGLYHGEPVALGKSACYINVNERNSKQFIRYVLENEDFQRYARDFATGSTIKNLGLKAIRDYSFNLPPLPTQRKIASILSAYDELIENNLKRIKLFEEKAQLHYKELISNGNTEKRYFEEFCSIIHGYAFKSTDFSEDKTFDVVVRMGNFREGGGLQFENNTKYLTEHFEYNPKYKLEANDLVMVLSDVTREGRIIGNVGFVPANDKTYLLNQRVGKIVSDEKYKVWLYATFNSKEFKDYCLSCANSATVLNFNNKDLFKFKITIPKETELKAFTEKVNPIFTLISSLGEQNSKLREARDILLPRLMSGQIEV